MKEIENLTCKDVEINGSRYLVFTGQILSRLYGGKNGDTYFDFNFRVPYHYHSQDFYNKDKIIKEIEEALKFLFFNDPCRFI